MPPSDSWSWIGGTAVSRLWLGPTRRACFLLEGLGTGAYELSLAGSPNQSWPVEIAVLGDEVALGDLLSSEGNRFSLEIWTGASMKSNALVAIATAVVLNDFGGVERRTASFDASRTDAGLFVWNGLPAGHYEIRVGDRQGNRWREELVQLFGNDHLQMELDVVPVEGTCAPGRRASCCCDALVWWSLGNGAHGVQDQLPG